jgi:hypothetical protein
MVIALRFRAQLSRRAVITSSSLSHELLTSFSSDFTAAIALASANKLLCMTVVEELTHYPEFAVLEGLVFLCIAKSWQLVVPAGTIPKLALHTVTRPLLFCESVIGFAHSGSYLGHKKMSVLPMLSQDDNK